VAHLEQPPKVKILLSTLLALVVALAVGCEMKKDPQGLTVEFKADRATEMKSALSPVLTARGFRMVDPTYFVLTESPRSSPRISAFFRDIPEHPGFTIGKTTSNFTTEEMQLMDECAALLTAHADAIASGRVLKGATSPGARENFYAKIKRR
jgi:hypothetical protein